MGWPRLDLRRFDRSDFTRLIAWAESPEFLFQWAGPIFTYPLDLPQLERYLLLAAGDPPNRRIFTALIEQPPGPPQAAGHIELSSIDLRHRSATLSRVLIGPAWRGQGLGQSMVSQVAAFAFDELDLHRLDLYVFDFNHAAIACYQRVGFVREGLLRDARRVGDAYWSVIVMSLLAPEWQSRRAPPP
jgi:RimJ/RimL family protein N-acetyltransferase